jgi:hypothetical protein
VDMVDPQATSRISKLAGFSLVPSECTACSSSNEDSSSSSRTLLLVSPQPPLLTRASALISDCKVPVLPALASLVLRISLPVGTPSACSAVSELCACADLLFGVRLGGLRERSLPDDEGVLPPDPLFVCLSGEGELPGELERSLSLVVEDDDGDKTSCGFCGCCGGGGGGDDDTLVIQPALCEPREGAGDSSSPVCLTLCCS